MPSYCQRCGEMMKGTSCSCGGRGAQQKADSFSGDGNAPVHTQYTDAYVSAGLSNVNDGLRRMLDMKPEWIDKNCCKCGKACTDGALEGPVGADLGKPFCKTCFAKNFAKGECAGCHQPVYGFGGEEYVKDGGKVFHNQCFNEERRCHNCRKPIFGKAVNALGRDYHENCFQCGKCQAQFKNGQYCDFNGAPYCGDCYDESSKTKKGITKTVQVNSNQTNDLNAKVAERKGELDELKKFQHVAIGDVCTKCGKDILTGALTSGSGALYHFECFKCVACGKDFPDMKFVEKPEGVYHPDCSAKAGADKCFGCKQPIVKGKQVQYEGQKYHSDCFKCSSCHKSLSGLPFGNLANGNVACESCLSKGATNQVMHGEYRAGFTVNPVSGSKETRGFQGAKIIPSNTQNLGQGQNCPGCDKKVYMDDKCQGPQGANWHRNCLKCKTCSKQLDSMANLRGNVVYCRDCVKKV